MRPGALSHVSGGSGYEDDGVASAEGMVAAGVYAQDIPHDMNMSFENSKAFF
jgi:hypothetical protein